jgi:hypothetical protein
VNDSLSALDLASLLGVTERTLRRWEEAGTGPKRIVENLEPIYPLETLVPWLKKNRPDVKLGAAAEVSDRAGRLRLLQAWERVLCKRYGLESTQVLYEALRHADFHATGISGVPDEIEHWHLAAYAAFSGLIVRHRLNGQRLQELLSDFQNCRDFGLAAKRDRTTEEFAEEIRQALKEIAVESFRNEGPDVPDLRRVRDYIAISHRYCCAVVRKYHPPPGNPNIMEDLAQLDKSESESQRV